MYYTFRNIAAESLKKLEKDLTSITDPEEKMIFSLTHIFDLAVPYVHGNAAAKEEDYLVENQIGSVAFRDIFQDQLKKIIHEGNELDQFHVEDVELTFRFIYGIISESMVIVHQYPNRYILDDVIHIILKILH